MRHCGNCEYSYKMEDIENLGSNEDQIANFPEIGTCCLSLTFEDGYCSSHTYVEELIDSDIEEFALTEEKSDEQSGPIRSLKLK